MNDLKKLKQMNFSEPMVVFPLKQYSELMNYIEDIEDRLAVKERKDEETITKEDFDQMFHRKFFAK
jgi:hypothetical protein